MQIINYLKFIFLIIIFSISCFSFGQNMNIYGTVNDTLNKRPKENAVVMLVRLSDSVLIDFQRTNENGEFYISTPMDTVEIIISHHQNDDKIIFFFPSIDRLNLDLSNTILPEKSEMMEEVTIYAYKDPVFFRGDTLVFLADSFQTKKNAVVEDLLKKLPGVEVDKSGNITSQGREVNKVLVDGDEFFGSDPTIATKNLGAKSIESVEIYEEENTDGDETSEETIQVMDLRLKEDAKKGYFGRISLATDFGTTPNVDYLSNFLESEVLFNRFNKDFKLSVFNLASNTPRANFGYGDIKQYGLSTSNGNFFSDDDRGGWWGASNQFNNNGIPQTIKSGLFFSNKLNDKVKVGFNYSRNQTDLLSESNRNTQYILRDTTYTVGEQNQSRQENQDHLINGRLEIKLDSLTEIEILPTYSLSLDSTSNFLENHFLTRSGDTNSISNVSQDYKSRSSTFATEFRLKREFKKKDRLLKYAFQYRQTENDQDQFNYTRNEYSDPLYQNDTLDQLQDFFSNSDRYRSQLLLREPITKKWGIDIEHLFQINNSEQRLETFDFNTFSSDYSNLDSLFSNNFQNTKQTNRTGLFYRYRYKKNSLKLGAYARNVLIINQGLDGTPLTDDLNFWDVLPQISYRHKFSNSQRFRFNYRTNSRQPSLNQLQPVQNNANPNRISQGNPELVPDYTHMLSASYNHWKGLTGSYVWTNLTHRTVQNAFSTEVTYDSLGRSISKSINVDQQQFNSFNLGGKIPIGNTPLGLRGGTFTAYNITKNIIDGLENTTKTFSNRADLSLEFETDSLFFEIGAELSYSKPNNSLPFYNNIPFTTQNYFAELSLELPWNMEFEIVGDYTINNQWADGYNISFLLLDCYIGKRFLENENLILAIEGNDILNQNTMVQRSIQNNMIIDDQTTIISRYFLLKMTYKFNNNKTKVKDESFH